MSILSMCNYRVQARGFNYYKKKLVRNIEKIDERSYSAIVKGTTDYNVKIDLINYKKCQCSCPYNKKICKHIVALYYELNPNEALTYEKELKEEIALEKEYRQKKMNEYNLIHSNAVEYVNSLTVDEMKQMLISSIVAENYCNSFDYYDERYEEEFEILDELDDDVIDLIDKGEKDEIQVPYPIHKLSEFIDAFGMITGDDSWLDLDTCEVYDEYCFEAEGMDDDEIEEFYMSPKVISLPGHAELNEYGDMVSFVDSLTDNYVKEKLYKALNGKGAFGRFKKEISYFGLREKWFKYRDECLKQKVIAWLKQNRIEYEE